MTGKPMSTDITWRLLNLSQGSLPYPTASAVDLEKEFHENEIYSS